MHMTFSKSNITGPEDRLVIARGWVEGWPDYELCSDETVLS